MAQSLYGLYKSIETISQKSVGINEIGIDDTNLAALSEDKQELVSLLLKEFAGVKMNLDPHNWSAIVNWGAKIKKYKDPVYKFKVRGKELSIETHSESLSHSQIPKIALPKYQGSGDLLK